MDLLERIKSGDEGALESLLRESWDPLVRYLMTIVSNGDQAKDAGQEAFITLWARRDRWEPGSARGLLFRLGRNAALDMVRKDKVRSRWARRRAGEKSFPGPTPEEEVLAAEFTERLRAAVEQLPARRREVFELVRFRGLSYAEVASVLGLSHQTVANQMALAHRDLRQAMADILRDGRETENGARCTRSKNG